MPDRKRMTGGSPHPHTRSRTRTRPRTFRAGAVVATTAALLGGLAAAPAQASWSNEMRACKNAYGSEVYLDMDIPTVVLAKGSSGVCVREVQELLLAVNAVRAEDRPGFIDGSFGSKTHRAVVAYQHSDGVRGGADGVVGRNTWQALVADVYWPE
ncbi:peptidoglycan-binding protein [Streptomyces sp. NPDC097619]|uniref:peptidoglycan-binding domain-containing protein n=1 Tax=Streptomyces sp. NPDC097619 TaxID=3157228 RepID=UPI003324143B